jgi:hypothetical protein
VSDAAEIEPGHAAEERPQDLDLHTGRAAPGAGNGPGDASSAG